jgi:formyltetrahydrofolate synthetase
MAVKKVDDKDEKIKALTEDNAQQKKIIHEIKKLNHAGGKQIEEMSQDILDIHDSLSNLFVRVQRVIDRYNIGTVVTIGKGTPPEDGFISFLKDLSEEGKNNG